VRSSAKPGGGISPPPAEFSDVSDHDHHWAVQEDHDPAFSQQVRDIAEKHLDRGR
jgi:predicted ATP-grasp superfamily ATP-dependent carboligase